MHVKIYSHNFAVTDYGRYGYEFLKRFGISNFGETDYRAVRMNRYGSRFNREPLPTIKRTYATSLTNGREFRFHVNCLDMFKKAVSNDPTLCNDVVYEYAEYYTPIPMDLNVLPKYIAREEQVPLINYLESPGYSKVLTLRTGGGKMQDVKEPVLTPKGWVAIGDLKVGDEVFTPKGKRAKVNGIFHHSNKPLYHVYLADGRSTIAGGEHLWYVRQDGGKFHYVAETDGLAARMECGAKLEIPVISEFVGFDKNLETPLPMDPFLYGIHFSLSVMYSGGITLNITNRATLERVKACATNIGLKVVLRDNDPQPTRRVLRCIEEDSEAYNDYRKILKGFGIPFISRHSRIIDERYLNGSRNTRLALLDGILAGLSEIPLCKRVRKQYAVTGEKVFKQILYLCRSLGFRVDYHPIINRRTDGLATYAMTITRSKQEWVGIDTIEYAKTADAVCISIDDPEHLYVTRDFIVTHNTYCALQASADLKGRIVISIEKRFFNLWEEALCPGEKQILDLKEDEVLFISGSKELKALMELAIEDKLQEIKVIIIAARTLGIFFETYERYGKYILDYYPVAPIDFYELLQAKVRIKDELHLSLHANFVEELYLHGAKSFSLSATLEDGSFRDKILAIMFPHEMRAPASELAQYISCTALFYSLNQPDKAEYTLRGQTDYNHNQYEKWILKDKKRLFNYLSIASDWVNHRFIKVRQEGQRSAIFATSVDMATKMLEFLKRSHPDLKIARYAASAGDIYEEARKADLLITTVQSFGTGFDLDGLICCLMTSSINSRNTNIQVLGRLRELRKWPDLVPVFDYLVCVDIPKQMAYHEEKMNQFEGRVKDHKTAYIKLKV